MECKIKLFDQLCIYFMDFMGILICPKLLETVRKRPSPVNTEHLSNICTTSVQRIRRWSRPTL